MKRFILLTCLCLAALRPAFGQVAMEGVVRIVDGDTFDLDVWRVRLHGLDAPELYQVCERGGERWRCGLEAMRALNRLTRDKTVRCLGKGRDAFSLVIAVCHVGEVEINAYMVAQGWAVALGGKDGDYGKEEEQALAAGAGIWAGRFATPERWRRGERALE